MESGKGVGCRYCQRFVLQPCQFPADCPNLPSDTTRADEFDWGRHLSNCEITGDWTVPPVPLKKKAT